MQPEDPVSTKTIWLELHKSSTHGKAAIAKLLITEKALQDEKDDMLTKKSGHLMIGNT